MRLRQALGWLRPTVTIWVVTALALLGQAHLGSHERPALDLAAFALPDGSLPELCHGDMPAQPLPSGDEGQLACQIACALAGTPMVLPPAPTVERLATLARRLDVPLSLGTSPRLAGGWPQARAPPVSRT